MDKQVNKTTNKLSLKKLIIVKIFTSLILIGVILSLSLVFGVNPSTENKQVKPLQYNETLTSLEPINLELIRYYQQNKEEYKQLNQQNKIILGGQWFNYWRFNK